MILYDSHFTPESLIPSDVTDGGAGCGRDEASSVPGSGMVEFRSRGPCQSLLWRDGGVGPKTEQDKGGGVQV